MEFLDKIKLLILNKKISHLIPDEIYLKKLYKIRMHKKLSLKSPKTFNEKLQWLKLNDRKQIYTNLVDKYEAKKIIEKTIGKEYVIPTLGIYNKFEEIKFDELPNKFVIKCTHDSGGVLICENKDKFDVEKCRKKIEFLLRNNFFYHSREWPYKNVKPRIIIEKHIGKNLMDFRFYCFNGKAKYIYIYNNESQKDNSKPEPINCDIYDINWKKANFRQKCSPSNKNIQKPKNFKKMVSIAEKISALSPFLRVDFYEVKGILYIGELTFYPGSGMSPFYPNEYDKILGDMLDINNIK